MAKTDENSLLGNELKQILETFSIDRKDLLELPRFIEQLELAVRCEEHEGKIPPYGAIFTTDIKRLAGYEMLPISSETTAEQISDGVSSFAVFEKDKLVGVLVTPEQSEQDLADTLSQFDTTVLVRRTDGTVELFLSYQGILLQRSRTWTFKPHIQSTIELVQYAFPDLNKAILRTILRTILNFAVHRLSPNRIGATLVWCLNHPTPAELEPMQPIEDLSACRLRLDNSKHAPILANLLNQTDGATLLSPDATVIGIGAHLVYSDKSKMYITEHRGTRHTSAQRFSYDYDNGILITVSSDGPVSVYSDGVRVADVRRYNVGDHADRLARIVPGKAHAIEVHSHQTVCPTCGKTSAIEEVVVRGMRIPETAECPICNSKILSKDSWDLQAHIIKKLR